MQWVHYKQPMLTFYSYLCLTVTSKIYNFRKSKYTTHMIIFSQLQSKSLVCMASPLPIFKLSCKETLMSWRPHEATVAPPALVSDHDG